MGKRIFEESRVTKSKSLEQLKKNKAQELKYRCKRADKKKFGTDNDLDANWIIENIINSKCIYCGESDWNKLGCDRIDNSKPHTRDNIVCACGRCNIVRGDKFTVDEMKEIGETIKRIEKRNTVYKVTKKKGKTVCKIDKDGNILKIYPSLTETTADGYDRTCVGKACKSYREKSGYDRTVYRGYYWSFL